jgi:hypothetical protein
MICYGKIWCVFRTLDLVVPEDLGGERGLAAAAHAGDADHLPAAGSAHHHLLDLLLGQLHAGAHHPLALGFRVHGHRPCGLGVLAHVRRHLHAHGRHSRGLTVRNPLHGHGDGDGDGRRRDLLDAALEAADARVGVVAEAAHGADDVGRGVAPEPALDAAVGGLHPPRELRGAVDVPARGRGGAAGQLQRLAHPRRQLPDLPGAAAAALHEREQRLHAPAQALRGGPAQEGALHRAQHLPQRVPGQLLEDELFHGSSLVAFAFACVFGVVQLGVEWWGVAIGVGGGGRRVWSRRSGAEGVV